MKIDKVEIQGFHKIKSATYSFDNCNYIYGPNGSGKSSILQSIQLCLLGYIPDTNKTTSAIFKHANDKHMKIVVHLKDDDGSKVVVSRSFKKFGQKIETSVDILPQEYSLEDIVGSVGLPILNFSEFLSMTANAQKDYLGSILVSKFEPINISTFLKDSEYYDDSLESFVDELAGDIEYLETIGDIKSFNEYLKSMQSQLAASQKGLNATIQSLVYYDDYTGRKNPDDIKHDLEVYRKRHDEYMQKKYKEMEYHKLKFELDHIKNLDDDTDYEAQLKEVTDKLNEVEAKRDEVSEQKQKLLEISYAKQHEFDSLVKLLNSGNICPVLNTKCNIVEQVQEDASSQISVLEDELNELSNQIDGYTNTESDLKEKAAYYSQTYYKLTQKRKDHENALEERDRLQKKLEEFDVSELENIEVVDERIIGDLQEELAKCEANIKYENLMHNIQVESSELDLKLAFVKDAVKWTGPNGLQTNVLLEAFDSMNTIMKFVQTSFYLEELGEPEFVLTNKANSFNFGFRREKILIPFEMLSSGEKCIFTLMFMIGLAAYSSDMLKFILIDDLFDHLDKTKYQTVINHMKDISQDVQIIVAGVNECEAEGVNTIKLL